MTHEEETYYNIKNILRAETRCPETLWNRLALTLQEKEKKLVRINRKRWIRRLVHYAAAAGVLVILSASAFSGIFFPGHIQKPTPTFLMLTEEDNLSCEKLPEDQSSSPVSYIVFDNAKKRLALPENNHYRFVALRETSYESEPVAEFLFRRNDGQAAKVVAVPSGGIAAAEMGKAVATGVVPAAKSSGTSIVGIIGTKSDAEILNLVDILLESECHELNAENNEQAVAENGSIADVSGTPQEEKFIVETNITNPNQSEETLVLQSSPSDLGV